MQRSLLVMALGLGGAASFVPACLIPDYCIVTFSYGQDWCRPLEEALMWPAGQPELAEPMVDAITGCRCMNDAEQAIMMAESPEADFIELSGELAILTRMECAALVPEGFEHNCMTLDGPLASSVGDSFAGAKSTDCIGSCSMSNPPPFKDCPELDPYECNGEPSPGEDEVGTEDSGSDGTDSGTEGGVPSDLPRAP